MSGTSYSNMNSVRVDWQENIAVVMLNTRENGNVLTHSLRRDLHSTLDNLSNQNERCRAIVLAGSGGSFYSDEGVGGVKNADASGAPASDRHALNIFEVLATGRRPVVAAVEGLAAGMGLSLAAACDYVVGTSEARFACSFDRNELLPEGGLYWSLARRIGAGRAREAMLTLRVLSGQQALEAGLANELVSPGNALEAAVKVAARYAKMPPVAMAWLKAAMATGSDTLDQAIETETNVQPLLRFTADHREAVQAFLQKRAANFVGS